MAEEKKTPQDKNLVESINTLDEDITVLDKDIKVLNKHNRLWPAFFRGIIGAIGAALGATVIIGLLIYILQQLQVVPVFGEFFWLILEQIRK